MSPNSPLSQAEGFVWGDTSVIKAVELAEQEAEERVREELTRWHDPKTERPETNVDVLIKLRDTYRDNKIHYSVGYINGACWFGDSIGAADEVVGWRELEKDE